MYHYHNSNHITASRLSWCKKF